MIKFFRKIRQKILIENLPSRKDTAKQVSGGQSYSRRNTGKAGKYLIYAIGEIVLVVIGILIALQINNLNENRKSRLVENSYLTGIKGDLQKDLNFLLQIEKDLEISSQKQKEVDSLYTRNLMQEKHLKELGVKRLMYGYTTFMSTAGNYNSLVSEGKVSIIQNRDLYNSIQQIYERMYPRIEKRGDRLDAIAVQISWDHRQFVNHGRFTLDYFQKSGYAEDIHRYHGEIRRYLYDLVEELILFLPEIIKMIEFELEKTI